MLEVPFLVCSSAGTPAMVGDRSNTWVVTCYITGDKLNRDQELKIAEAHANAMFAGIQLYREYMKKCEPMIMSVIPRPALKHRDGAIQAVWIRAYAWMQSLELLNHTKHIQAISAGNRSLLEFANDLVLLHTDPTNNSGWKMHHLAFSERLKAAEQLVDFYGAGNVPSVHSEAESFIQREKTSIDDMRRTLWPNPKNPGKAVHPDRWTGRDLFRDAEAADAAYGVQIKASLGMSLTEYYRTEYRRMNWLIHSTMAGVTNLDSIYYSTAVVLALKWCQELAMFCTQITLKDQQFHNAIDDLNEQWRELRRQRNLNYSMLVSKFDAGEAQSAETES